LKLTIEALKLLGLQPQISKRISQAEPQTTNQYCS
jgi:hypothetical protein